MKWYERALIIVGFLLLFGVLTYLSAYLPIDY